MALESSVAAYRVSARSHQVQTHDPRTSSNAQIKGARTAASRAWRPHNADDIGKKTHPEPKGLPQTGIRRRAQGLGRQPYDELERDRFFDEDALPAGGYNGWEPRRVHKMQTSQPWSYSNNDGRNSTAMATGISRWQPISGGAMSIKALRDAAHSSCAL